MTTTPRPRRGHLAAVLVVAALLGGCTSGGGSEGSSTTDPFGDPGNCTVIDVAVTRRV